MPEKTFFLLPNLVAGAIGVVLFIRNRKLLSGWKETTTAILICAGIFLGWEEAFTQLGIWGTNGKYVLGYYYASLPLETWLMVSVWPFAFIGLYHSISPARFFDRHHRAISVFFLVFCIITGWNFLGRAYTMVAALATAIVVALQLTLVKGHYMGRFYHTFFIALAPLIVLMVWLTGFTTAEPVVWYNDMENTGFRVLSVPIESFLYFFLLFLLNVTVFERTKSSKWKGKMNL